MLVEKLKPYGESADRLYPFIRNAKRVLFVEEGMLNGGYSMITEATLRKIHPDTADIRMDIAAIDDNFAIPEYKCDIYDYLGLSAEKLAKRMKNIIDLEI